MKKIHKIALGVGFLVVAAASVPSFNLWSFRDAFRDWSRQSKDTSFHWQKPEGESPLVSLVEQAVGMNISPRAQVVDDYADYSSWVDGASYLGLIALDEATFKKVYEKCQKLTRQSKVTYEYISQTPSPLEDEITKSADMRFYSSDINRTTILFLKKDRCHIGVLSFGT